MIRRFHEAKITWRFLRHPPGLRRCPAGVPLHTDDLARLVAREIGYQGEILWDTTRPDGTASKLMDR